MSKKCFVYEDEIIEDNQIVPSCPRGNLTASCVDVSDVKLDLAMLSPRVNSLCLTAAHGLVLRPNAFKRFSILEQLHIRYCPRAIHPGAFAGLPNLRLISFDGHFFKNTACRSTSVSANAFGQLPSLSELFFYYYNMSAISTDVFSGIKELQHLHFQSCGTEILDIACKTVELSQSLTSLYVGTDDTVVLGRQHCPRLEDASTDEHFKTLKRISFVFPGLKSLGECVFKYSVA
ncbi:toll-like receptor 13 [Tachysurus ichikawai]